MDKQIELTEEEVMKALELCSQDGSCLWENECPLRDDKNCHVTLAREALVLLKLYKCEAIRERTDGVRLFEMLTDKIQGRKD